MGFTTYFTSESIKLSSEANRLSQRTLELQNMLSNYTSAITVESEPAQLMESIESGFSNDSVFETRHHGYLNVSLKIISPHVANVSIKIKSFDVENMYNFFLPEKENQTSVTFLYPNAKYEDIIVAGFIQRDFSIFIKRFTLSKCYTATR